MFFIAILLSCQFVYGGELIIQTRVADTPWRQTKSVYPLKGQQVVLRVAEIPDGKITWYQIRPKLDKIYKNANLPWDPNPYIWIGLDRIEYQRIPMDEFAGQWEIKPFAAQAVQSPGPYYHPDVGSFWFQAEVEHNGITERSPGVEHTDNGGISSKVLRISIRDGDDFLGYVTSYFNVPAIFGSTTKQSNNYQGVDCADVLLAAYARLLGLVMSKNYNVAMVVKKFPVVAQSSNQNGVINPPIIWDRDIRRGDLIAVRYSEEKQYQHIGALVADVNGNGMLDSVDSIIHTGPWPLEYTNLGDGGFDGTIVILRPGGRL